MMAAPTDNWGPWSPEINAAERLARLRSLRAIIQCAYGVLHPMNRALFMAESLEPEDLLAASLELGRMAARDRRKILSTYAALIAYKAQRSAEGR
jgi:hypothetical protein